MSLRGLEARPRRLPSTRAGVGWAWLGWQRSTRSGRRSSRGGRHSARRGIRRRSARAACARGADAELVIRPEARDAILRAEAAGVALAILSNELDLFYGAAFRQRFPLIERFGVIVDATYTNILKPDPRAYELVLAELGLPREACVFVDDQVKNIEGAEAVGLPSVLFDVTRPAQSYDRALHMLGLDITGA